jgi:hypothetical protein
MQPVVDRKVPGGPKVKKGLPEQALLNLDNLLGLLLFLLADADLEMRLLGFLMGLVIVPGHCVSEVRIYIGFAREHRHQGEGVVASGAIGPKTLHIGDWHTVLL